jgi:hypothetical protein
MAICTSEIKKKNQKQNNYMQNITRKAIQLLEPWIDLDPHTAHQEGVPQASTKGVSL